MKLDLKSMLFGTVVAAVCVLGSLAATSPPSDSNEVGRYVLEEFTANGFVVYDTMTGALYFLTYSEGGAGNVDMVNPITLEKQAVGTFPSRQ